MAVLCTRLASLLAHFSLSSSAPRSFAARFGKAKRAIAALAIPELAFNQLKKDFLNFQWVKKEHISMRSLANPHQVILLPMRLIK
jgi:hypothetical protein